MKNIIIFLFFTVYAIYSQQLNISSHSLKDTSSANRYEITAYYPQMNFGQDALMGMHGIEQDINTEILKIINGQVIPFKLQSEEDKLDCPQELNTLEINYSIPYKKNGYICVLFESFSSPRCAAHPMTFQTSFNYSYKSKGLLTIDSLFKSDSHWLKYISDYCTQELIKRAQNDSLIDYKENIMQGAGPKSENFRTFTIDDKFLTIIFNLYQVGPYVWGFQRVEVPWNNINKMLDPVGPADFLIKK
ncbi:MAG: DUF3298 domain-containing protein [Ignavibacteria bacterium]|nr:DUF3298 domain-containing protein [Ignavibacteria bacterium]